MKAVVVYKSKTGYVKRYAEWISEALGCEVLENKRLKAADLQKYDMIILGGGLYAGSINGFDFLKRNFDSLKEKQIILWTTGLNPGREEDMAPIWMRTLTEDQRAKCKTFYLRGGIDFNKLRGMDKWMMKIFCAMLRKKKNPTEEDIGMLSVCERPQNFMERKNITPLIDYAKKQMDDL